MPRGFDTPSGGSLSATQKEAAMKFLSVLKLEREQGITTPERPWQGAKIAERFNAKHGTSYTNVHVRSWVNYLRGLEYPVCSNAKGYFYGITEIEIEESMKHVVDRRDSLNHILRGMSGAAARARAQTTVAAMSA